MNFVGHGAVGIFFVLSGFVIAFVASGRENTPRVFLRARAERIYSVALPAIVVTVLADGGSRLADPPFYRSLIYAPFVAVGDPGQPVLPQPEQAVRRPAATERADLVARLRGSVRSRLRLLPVPARNGPAALPRDPDRRGSTGGVAGVPVWLGSVGLFRVPNGSPPRRWRAFAATTAGAGLLLRYGRAIDWQSRAFALERSSWSGSSFGHSGDVVMFAYAALLAALSIVVVDQAGVSMTGDGRIARAIRLLAGSTFSIYLFHMPLVVRLYATTQYDRTNPLYPWLAGSVAVAASALLGVLTERRQRDWAMRFDRSLDAGRARRRDVLERV